MEFYFLDSSEDTVCYGVISENDKEYIDLSVDPTSLQWKAVELVEKQSDYGDCNRQADFHTTSWLAFLVSENMYSKIGGILEKTGVLLPVNIQGRKQKFYRYHCTNIVDCLNLEKSKYRVIKRGFFSKKIGISSPVFDSDKIENQMIFRVPNTVVPKVFVTDQFKKIVVENKLTGIKLMIDEYDFDGWES